MSFSQASSYFLSSANVLLSNVLPNTLNLLSSFRVRDQISKSHNRTQKILLINLSNNMSWYLTCTLYQISSYSSFVIRNRQNVITSVTQLWNSLMVFSNSMWLKVFIACKLWSFFENSSSLSPHTEVMYFDVRAIVPGQQKKYHKKTTTILFYILFVKESINNTKIKNVWSYTSKLPYVTGCVA